MYDGQIGRWMVIDPKSDKYFEWSCYNYVKNNPLNTIDPNGKEVKGANEKSQQQVLQYLNTLLGKDNGFSFKDGKLGYDKASDKGAANRGADAKDIVNGILEVIKSDKKVYVAVLDDEKDKTTIKEKSTFGFPVDNPVEISNNFFLSPL